MKCTIIVYKKKKRKKIISGYYIFPFRIAILASIDDRESDFFKKKKKCVRGFRDEQ